MTEKTSPTLSRDSLFACRRHIGISCFRRNIPAIFFDVQQVIEANERNRQMSWLGRPLERVFFIFGADKQGRELHFDLDFPEPPVLVADHKRKRGSLLAQTFGDWISRNDHVT